MPKYLRYVFMHANGFSSEQLGTVLFMSMHEAFEIKNDPANKETLATSRIVPVYVELSENKTNGQ